MSFNHLYALTGFSGVFRIGNAPYEKGTYVLQIPNHGYVAVYIDGDESAVFDPKGGLHPSIREFLKMCNVHRYTYNQARYETNGSAKIADFVKLSLGYLIRRKSL